MTDKLHMRDAAPHIETALRSIEMLRHFVENRENLSLAKRVPQYYESLVNSVLALQQVLMTDLEYIDRANRGLKKASGSRVLHWQITQNNKGKMFCSVDGLLSIDELMATTLFNRKVESHVN